MNDELEKLREYESRYEAEIKAARFALEHDLPGDHQLSRLATLLSDCKKAIAQMTMVKSQRDLQ